MPAASVRRSHALIPKDLWPRDKVICRPNVPQCDRCVGSEQITRAAELFSEAGEDVTELTLFRAQVGFGMMRGARPTGNALDDVHAGLLELGDLVGIVR